MKTQNGLRVAAAATVLASLAVHAGSVVVKGAAAPPFFDDAQSCKDLPAILEKLLAAGAIADGTSLTASSLYAVHYPAGSNPNATELYATIPAAAYGPHDDMAGAISASNGWDQIEVTTDSDYGEQAKTSYARLGGLPAFCRIGGMIQTSPGDSKSQFEIWMPLADQPDPTDVRTTANAAPAPADGPAGSIAKRAADDAKNSFRRACSSGWNKRLVFVVGGGLRGAIAYPEMKQTMARYRVAVAGTNMGHFSAQDGAEWIPGNTESWTDYGHRAVHLSSLVAKLAVSTFYDAIPSPKNVKGAIRVKGEIPVFHSYLKGCSTGGRAAMSSVQKWPGDFDGVLAGSPAMDFNNVKAYQIHVNTFLHDNKSESFIPSAAYPLINQAVIKSCDALDGVQDSVISLPRQCKPDFAKFVGCKSLGITTPSKVDAAGATTVKADPITAEARKTDPVDGKVAAPAAGMEGISVPPAEPKAPLLPRDVAAEPAPLVDAANSVAAPWEAGVKDDPTKMTADEQTSIKGATTKGSAAESASVKDATPKTSNTKDLKAKDTKAAKGVKSDDEPKGTPPRCLTDAQLETLKNLYTPYSIDGKLISEGILPGSELGWTANSAIVGKYGASSTSWFHYQVKGDTVFDDKAFDATKEVTPELIAEGEKKNPGEIIAFNPDIGAFFEQGGKLIHYHGLADPLIPPMVSPRYYEMVKAKVGDKVRNGYRMYMIPGMLHCRGGTGCFNFGGAGQADKAGLRPLSYDAKHDMFLALVDWVEKGEAPMSLIGAAYKSANGGPPEKITDETPFGNGLLNTRPLCPYPTEARLKRGKQADHTDASAFECA